jgi:hypothetical protein
VPHEVPGTVLCVLVANGGMQTARGPASHAESAGSLSGRASEPTGVAVASSAEEAEEAGGTLTSVPASLAPHEASGAESADKITAAMWRACMLTIAARIGPTRKC